MSDFSAAFVSSRRKLWWLAIAFLSGFGLAMIAEDLMLSWHDNHLEFSAPRIHFLTGKPLDRLHNAADVPFDFQISLWSDSKTHLYRRTAARFVVSYDVWEETFSVVKLQTPRKMASHLSGPAAEAWCLSQMPLDAAGLDDAQKIWARLEIRAQDGKEGAPLFGRGNLSDSGISLTSLIEIFSRPAQGGLPHWTVDAGPLTIEDLKRSNGRGS